MQGWQIAGSNMTFKDQHFFIISWRFITAPVWNVTCSKSACSESGWKHKESGDFSVAVSARSNHRINHDWIRFCRNLQLSSASGQRLAQFGPEKRQGWWLGGGRCLLLSVCVLWTFAPLCYIYVPMDSVNPGLTCKADLYWEGTLCCWLMFGDTFTAAAGEQCSAPSPNCLLWF